ncbi:MAG: hypothetical protein SGJ27_09870 [Candidatus Melainabacteria bacterium]|nr:hypothetical protein [Candidatus Melainabacteria bacterium]
MINLFKSGKILFSSRMRADSFAFLLALLTAGIAPLTATTAMASGLTDTPEVDQQAPISESSIAGHRTLAQGPLLLSPSNDTVVDTAFGAVTVDMGSVVLIIVNDNELAVYNLHDSHKGAVLISRDSRTISIPPQHVAVLAKSSMESFEEVNPAPFVAYRQVSSQDLSREIKLYQAEFEFTSMISGLPALQKLMADKTGPIKKTMGRMLKTAAIMRQLSSGGEAYSYYLTDRVRTLSILSKP